MTLISRGTRKGGRGGGKKKLAKVLQWGRKGKENVPARSSIGEGKKGRKNGLTRPSTRGMEEKGGVDCLELESLLTSPWKKKNRGDDPPFLAIKKKGRAHFFDSGRGGGMSPSTPPGRPRRKKRGKGAVRIRKKGGGLHSDRTRKERERKRRGDKALLLCGQKERGRGQR